MEKDKDLIFIIIIFFCIGVVVGLMINTNKSFNEDRAIEIIEDKLRNPDRIYRFNDMVIQKNLTIHQAIDLYFRYGIVSEYCLRREVRAICLNSD